MEIVSRLAGEISALPHGETTPRVQGVAQALGVSPQTLWRWLRAAGYRSARRQRCDAGQLRAISAEQVRAIAAIRFAGARETGKILPTFEMARAIANANARPDPETGELSVVEVHRSTLSRAMRTIGCHTDQLMRQTPATALRSRHPNHVWQIDVSTCVLFYLANGGMEICDAAAFNKNKPTNFARVQQLRVQRYLAVDHTSGAFYLAYLSGHESSENFLTFLIDAFHQRDGLPFYGVPTAIVVDPGSAQSASVVRSLTRSLDINVIVHQAHNARAKGSVETTHNLVERQFEGRLHATPVCDFARLNVLARRWSAAFQSKSIHTRHGMTRFDAWLRITREQLRLAPGPEITRALVLSEPEARTVDVRLRISFAPPGHGQQWYSVAGIPGAAVGERVFVQASPYALPAIDVLYTDAEGGERRQRVAPIEVDAFGFDLQAPVIGERFADPGDSFIDRERKAARRAAWGTDDEDEIAKLRRGKGGVRGVAFGGELDAFADVAAVEVPAYLPRPGTVIALDATPAETLIDPTAACLRLAALLGDVWRPSHYMWIHERFARGISEQQLEQLAREWSGRAGGADDGSRRAVAC